MLPENIFIDGKVIFYGHGGVTNNLFAIAVNGYNMCNPKHLQLFILVQMNLLSHVVCLVWYGVEVASTLKEDKNNVTKQASTLSSTDPDTATPNLRLAYLSQFHAWLF